MSINIRQLFKSKHIDHVFLLLLISSSLAWGSEPRHLLVVNGTVKFNAVTNIRALTVDGRSNQMTADLTLDGSGPSLDLEHIRATVDPRTLTTGMSLRDRHMRDKIFALADGTIPELQFLASRTACPKPESHQEVICPVSGQLTLRGVTQQFAIDLKVHNDVNAYRLDGGGLLKLSAFGIEAPCQLGVCVNDEVKVTFTFQAKEAGTHMAGVR